jgi:TDG/mug DNA glycosylase family protein
MNALVSSDILPDVLIDGLDLVFCGTAPSKTSAAARAYYANPRNRFWKILHECNFTAVELMPSKFYQLTNSKMGLTDLCKLESRSDDKLKTSSFLPERLRQSIEKYRPRFLAFTSKNAGRQFLGKSANYGPQQDVGHTKVYILPTTSPRRGDVWWNEKKSYWQEFAVEFHETCRAKEID